jgi:hypothetical protein
LFPGFRIAAPWAIIFRAFSALKKTSFLSKTAKIDITDILVGYSFFFDIKSGQAL